ncbi:internal (core) protein [Pseudomonas phage vB_PaeM_FBPa35]|uniref:Internal (Core) protein n=1 Tax=Pseudomonas phage vB_PaeM_FBPa35 TaxID=2969608 RepID=A0A9E7U2W3_9CAUD|nr:internal (core) protein [Pseudomonas phage vB_PaeM_FBPa35]
MSSDLDEFILRYEADTARAERNLERLQNQIRRVNSASTSGLQDLRHFADGAATELGRVVPQIDSVTSAIRGMNAQLAIGATGVALVAAGVKAFMNTRDQYNQQRIQAMDIGIAPARLEEYQRKFVRQSGGTISREQGAEMTKNLADTFRRAYRDIGRVGPEARILRMAGVDVGSFQKGMRPLNDIITDLATKMAKLKPDEISAYADALGVSRDYLSTLAKIGPAMGKVTEMTTAELQSRVQGESNIQKFNDALANLNQTFTTLENRVGEKLAPAFTKLIEIIDKIVQAIPNEVESFAKDTKSRWEDGVLGKATVGSDILSLLSPGALLGRLAAWGTRRGMEESGLIDKDKVPGAQTSEDLAKKQEDQDKATKSMKELEKLADQTTKSTNDFAVAINMFSGAVSSFANAVDERQAWAAWAGEIGRAVGMGSTAPTSRATGVYPHAIYDQSKSGAAGQVFGEPIGAQSLRNRMFSPQRKAEPINVPSYINDIIKDASKMYNIPELDIKKLIYTESPRKAATWIFAPMTVAGWRLRIRARRKTSAAKPVDMTTGLFGRRFASSTACQTAATARFSKCLSAKKPTGRILDSGNSRTRSVVRPSRTSRPNSLPEPSLKSSVLILTRSCAAKSAVLTCCSDTTKPSWASSRKSRPLRPRPAMYSFLQPSSPKLLPR